VSKQSTAGSFLLVTYVLRQLYIEYVKAANEWKIYV